MTVLFHDVHSKAGRADTTGKLEHFPYRELLYADDTLLLGYRARELIICIDLIVEESKLYNMKLNTGKCKHIDINCDPNIHFKDEQNYKKQKGGNT